MTTGTTKRSLTNPRTDLTCIAKTAFSLAFCSHCDPNGSFNCQTANSASVYKNTIP